MAPAGLLRPEKAPSKRTEPAISAWFSDGAGSPKLAAIGVVRGAEAWPQPLRRPPFEKRVLGAGQGKKWLAFKWQRRMASLWEVYRTESGEVGGRRAAS